MVGDHSIRHCITVSKGHSIRMVENHWSRVSIALSPLSYPVGRSTLGGPAKPVGRQQHTETVRFLTLGSSDPHQLHLPGSVASDPPEYLGLDSQSPPFIWSFGVEAENRK